jgi:hypothetical protein
MLAFDIKRADGDFMRLVITNPGFTYMVEGQRGIHVDQHQSGMLVIRQDTPDGRVRFSLSPEEMSALWDFLGKVLDKIN